MRRDTRRLLHLLWIVPLGVAVEFVAFKIAVFAWCGLITCAPSTSQYDLPPNVALALVLLAIAAVIVFTLIAFVPWAGSLHSRLVIAAVCAVVTAAALFWRLTELQPPGGWPSS